VQKSGVVSASKVYRICFTGGPCGGKTTALDKVREHLISKGMDVYCVPEVPTLLMNGGCKYPGIDNGEKLLHFESHLIRLQHATEDAFMGIANSTGKPSVVVTDRGLLDVKAYLPALTWKQILEYNKWSEHGFLARYDMVIHLVTTANGAEKFYTTTNNTARTETVQQARELDQNVLDCWKEHSRRRTIDNSTDFPGKMRRTISAIEELVVPK